MLRLTQKICFVFFNNGLERSKTKRRQLSSYTPNRGESSLQTHYKCRFSPACRVTARLVTNTNVKTCKKSIKWDFQFDKGSLSSLKIKPLSITSNNWNERLLKSFHSLEVKLKLSGPSRLRGKLSLQSHLENQGKEEKACNFSGLLHILNQKSFSLEKSIKRACNFFKKLLFISHKLSFPFKPLLDGIYFFNPSREQETICLLVHSSSF